MINLIDVPFCVKVQKGTSVPTYSEIFNTILILFLYFRTYNKLWIDTQTSIKDVINIEDQHQQGRPEKERFESP